MSESESARWASEFARLGEVRIAPRRRVAGVKTVLFGIILVSQVGTLISAGLGRQDWKWWPLLYLVMAPFFLALVLAQARSLLFGRPLLTIDGDGITLGRKQLAWVNIESVEGPGSRRRRSRDPRQPVETSRQWFEVVTVAPAEQRRKRQITIVNGYAKDLEALAEWLDTLRRQQQTGVVPT